MGKRAGLSTGSNDWSRYSYTSSSIEKRTGLTRQEIQQLRREAKEEATENNVKRTDGVWGVEREDGESSKKKGEIDPRGIDLRKGGSSGQSPGRISKLDTPVSIEWGIEGVEKIELGGDVGGFGGNIGYELGEGVSGTISAGGFGVELKPGGDGKIEIPGGTSITYVNKGCYVVEVYKMFGQITHTNIQKKPKCDEDDDNGNGGGGSSSGGENSPPHCGGKGSPRNLLPTCLAGSSQVYTFWIFPCFKSDYSNENWRPETGYYHSTGDDISLVSGFNNATYTANYYRKTTGTSEYEDPGIQANYEENFPHYLYVESEQSYEINVQSAFGFVGTYAGLLTRLSELGYPDTQVTEYIYENQGHEKRSLTHTTNYSQWAYVVADGVNCNPTGNEGCNNTSRKPSGDDETKKKKPPGKPNKGKGREEDDDMSRCCEETRELLLLILDAVGYNLSPIEVPDSLIDDENSKPVVLPNLASFIIWWFGRWDSVTGQFPQEVTIEDTDPLTKGNQLRKIKLENQAESISTIYTLVFTQLMQQQIELDMLHRTMLTAGLNRESGIRNEESLDAIIEYLGFEVKDVDKNIPQLFTTGKTNWDEILDESNSPIRTVEAEGKTTLQQQLMELLQAAAITRATSFKKINPYGDVKREIKESLLGSLTMAGRIRDIMGDDKAWEDFQEWVKLKNKDSKIREENINQFGRD